MGFSRQEYWRGLPCLFLGDLPNPGIQPVSLSSPALAGVFLYHNFPGGSGDKSVCLQCRRHGFDPWVGKIPWSRKWQPTPVFLPEESRGQRSLEGYRPWGRKESGVTEHSAWPWCAHQAGVYLMGPAASSPRTEHEAGSKTELKSTRANTC